MNSVEIQINIAEQRLALLRRGQPVAEYVVSTSRYGPGEREGSGGTPRGRHVVRASIGAGLPSGAVMRGRRPTGEIWSPELAARHPGRDWILTRILWLSGMEPGRNRGGDVDSMRRFIYIHGAPDSEPMGVPFSHGCVRMRNAEMMALFGQVVPGTPVHIVPA
jgi:lipoprotein-anchoring transpeptidase ErfK/SrfK